MSKITVIGIGAGIVFRLEDAGGSTGIRAADIAVVWNDASAGVNHGDIIFGTRDGAVNAWGDAGYEKMRIQYDGKVGIGTDSPLGALHIVNSTAFDLVAGTATGQDNILLINESNGVGEGNYGPGISFGFPTDSNNIGRRYASIASVQTTADNDQIGLAFITHPGTDSGDALVEQMRITHDGKVGIGTIAPDASLDIHSGSIHLHTDGNAELAFGDTGHAEEWYLRYDGGGAGDLVLATYDAGWYNVMFFDRSTRNIGIGTITPQQLLQIDSVVTPTVSQFMITANNLGGLSFLTYAVDNCAIAFDAEYNSVWKSTDAGSSFAIYKVADKLDFNYDIAAVGGTITWNTAMTIGVDGVLTVGGVVHRKIYVENDAPGPSGMVTGDLWIDLS